MYFSDDGFVVSRNARLIWRYLCFAFVESFKYYWTDSEYRLYCIDLQEDSPKFLPNKISLEIAWWNLLR